MASAEGVDKVCSLIKIAQCISHIDNIKFVKMALSFNRYPNQPTVLLIVPHKTQ